MDTNKENIFEEPNLPKAIWALALPTIIGMIITALYNIVDTFFIAQTHDPLQVAAVSLCMPIFMILMAFGNLFGVGASSCISRKLGEKNYDSIKNISATALYSAVFTGLTVLVIALLFLDTISLSLGANSQTLGYVNGYLAVIVIGAPFIIASLTLSHIVRSEGNAKTAMRGMLLSTIINLVLDPIFIFVLGFGVIGAAIATVIANIISFTFYVVMIRKNKETYLNLNIKYFTIKDKILNNILSIGVPASVASLLTSFSTIIYNLCLTPFGDEAVASMGIVMKIGLIYIMIFMGMSTGVQPFLGYCFGAKQYNRLKDALIYCIKTSILIGLAFLCVLYFLSNQAIAFFIDDANIIFYGTKMLKAQISTAPILGILFLSMAIMQATGKSLIAMLLSTSRQGTLFIPTIFILSHTYGFEGLIWVQPIADILALILSIAVLYIFFKKINE